MAAAVTVTKLNWQGRHVYAWQGELIARTAGHVVLRAVWHGPGTVQVSPEVTFDSGDVFYEHYYDHKPYGLWRVLSPDEQTLKCWYCNISTPAAFDGDNISFRDLLLDVLLLPDGSRRILDREELEAARAQGLDASLAALAEHGVREVLDLIDNSRPPFRDGENADEP